MVRLFPLSGVRADDVEILLDAAFGLERHQRTAYLLRRGLDAIDMLSFAATDDSALVGSIQCWPVAIADEPLILVGPVAVSPDRQNQGLGRQLMNATLAAAPDSPMVMIGDPEYYNRFRFVADKTSGWTLPGPCEPHRLLLRNPRDQKLPATGMIKPRL